MTKTKLAKLRAQANVNGPLDPTLDINEYDASNVANTMLHQGLAVGPALLHSANIPGQLAFCASEDSANLLMLQLNAWNADNRRPAAVHSGPAALFGMPMVGREVIVKKKKHNIPVSNEGDHAIYDSINPGPAIRNLPTQAIHNPTAALDRQQDIEKAVFESMFNYDAYTGPIIEGEDAESTLKNFQSGYELNFGTSDSFDI